jgi:hypothetical protein
MCCCNILDPATGDDGNQSLATNALDREFDRLRNRHELLVCSRQTDACNFPIVIIITTSDYSPTTIEICFVDVPQFAFSAENRSEKEESQLFNLTTNDVGRARISNRLSNLPILVKSMSINSASKTYEDLHRSRSHKPEGKEQQGKDSELHTG